MKKLIAATIGLCAVALFSSAQGLMGAYAGGGRGGAPYAGGWGMMGAYGGPGAWGGCGAAYGEVPGDRSPLDLDQAKAQADKYLALWKDDNLEVSEIMEFSNQFYVAFTEKDGKIGAFEMLMDKYSGALSPEPGPNMMWNLKYGMMARGYPSSAANPASAMPLSLSQADAAAQKYLDAAAAGYQAEKGGDAFHGYYTIHVLKDGKIVGMLGVNGYTGQVWYHGWHGDYEGMKSFE